MAKVFNPAALATKWAANFGRSGDAYKAGVMGVQVAPGVAAANAAQKYADRVAESVRNGTYQRKVQAVGLSQWQSAAVNLGIQRFSGGATKGQPKMQAYMTQAAPVYNDIAQTAAGMTNDGSTASQAAIVAMAIDKMKALKNSLN